MILKKKFSSYFIRINGELYGMKSKFHMHGTFFFFQLVFLRVSVRLDERLSTEGRRPRLSTVKESRVEIFDASSAFPDEEFPPDRRESND